MPNINEDIISEINGLQKTPEKIKKFLKWIIDFERENIEKDRYSFREAIEQELNKILAD